MWLEMKGVPVSDTIVRLMSKQEAEKDDFEDCPVIDPEEMWQRRKARLAEIEEQKQGLDQVRAEVAQIKEEPGDKVDMFKPGVMPGGES